MEKNGRAMIKGTCPGDPKGHNEPGRSSGAAEHGSRVLSVEQIESNDLVTDPAPAPESTTPRRRQLGRYALGVLILAGGLGGAALLAPAAARPMLTDADLKYLQDAEHFGGFVLGDRTLPLLAGALRDADAEAVKSFLADSFQGHLFAEDAGELTTYAFATFRRFDEDDGAAEPLDRDGFVETLLAYRAEFDERASVSFKVMQMQPVTYGELEGPWQGSLKLRLAGTRVEGGLAERVIRFRCSITGIDDDTPEAYGWLASCTAFQARYAFGEKRLMTDITAKTGIDVSKLHDTWNHSDSPKKPTITGGVFLSDFNQDGHLDLLLTDISGHQLYRGEGGGHFSDVTAEMGIDPKAPGIRAIFADFDGDGFEDLLLGEIIYRNDAGKKFVVLEPGRDTTLKLEHCTAYSVVDFDRDGRLDLYAVGLPQPMARHVGWLGDNDIDRNQLWRNTGDWKFQDVTEASGAKGNGAWTFAAVWFDANQDGWPDVMTACELGMNAFLINNGDGTFREVKLPKGFGGFSMGITVGDFDNDGLPDPYVANMYSKAGERIVANLRADAYEPGIDAQIRDFVTGSELYHNTDKGTFRRLGRTIGVADVGWAYGPSYVDLNNDGLLDLYAPVGFQSVTPDRPDG